MLHVSPAGSLGSPSGYVAENSGLFDDASAHLDIAAASWATSTERALATFSCWVKRVALGSDQKIFYWKGASNARTYVEFMSTDQLRFRHYSGSSYELDLETTAVFRDPTSWMHIFCIYDSANTNAEIWVNGTQITDFDVETYPSVSDTVCFGDDQNAWIGVREALDHDLRAYIREVACNPGTAHDVSDFGESDDYGNWVPKDLSGLTWDTNGFWIKDPSTGVDSSGNGRDFTVNGTITQVSDTPTDSVSKGVGNYAVLNALDPSASGATISDGNRNISYGSAAFRAANLTLACGDIDFYLEVTVGQNCLSTKAIEVGLYNGPVGTGSSPQDYSIYSSGSTWLYYDKGSSASGGSSLSAGDVIQFCKKGTDFWIGLNGTYYASGDPENESNPLNASPIDSDYIFLYLNVYNNDLTVNTGQTAFAHTPPSWAKDLATQNLPESTAVLSEHLEIVEWAGDATMPRTISTSLETVDFVALKNRSASQSWQVADTLRGGGASLNFDNTSAEGTPNQGYVGSFSDGDFVLTAGVGAGGGDLNVNESGDDYVAFCFCLPSDETNSDGDITVTWKYNTTLGVAIGTYTGTGVSGNTLGIPSAFGAAPFFIVGRTRTSSAQDWKATHRDAGTYGLSRLNLNDTNAISSDSTIWNSTAPTSSVITLGTSNSSNKSGDSYIIIAFFETDLCKPLAWSGNANADGSLIFANGQPEFFLSKRTSSTGEWFLYDTARSPENDGTTKRLAVDGAAAENTSANGLIDFLATGVKARGVDHPNASGTYIGVAFVNPLNPKGRGQARGLPHA